MLSLISLLFLLIGAVTMASSTATTAPTTVTITCNTATVGNENILTLSPDFGTGQRRSIGTITVRAQDNFKYIVNGRRSNSKRMITLISPRYTSDGTVVLTIKVLKDQPGVYMFDISINFDGIPAIDAEFSAKLVPVILVNSVNLELVGSHHCVRLRRRTKATPVAEVTLSGEPHTLSTSRRVSVRQRGRPQRVSGRNTEAKMSYSFTVRFGQVENYHLPYQVKLEADHELGLSVTASSNSSLSVCG